jgi:hypothetical protein
MKRKIEVCRCCHEFSIGRFNKNGCCAKSDALDFESVPKGCSYRLEHVVLSGEKNEVKQKRLQKMRCVLYV